MNSELIGTFQKHICLDDAGVELGIDQSTKKHGYLPIYEREFTDICKKPFTIVVIGNSDLASKEALVLCSYYKLSRVLLIRIGEPTSNIEAQETRLKVLHANSIHHVGVLLAAHGPVDIVIEHGNNKKSQKIELFSKLFMSVRNNGLYIIEDVHATYMEKFNDVDGLDVVSYINSINQAKASGNIKNLNSHDQAMVKAVEVVSDWGKLILIKRSEKLYLKKIREADAELFFANLGEEFAPKESVITPPNTHENRATCFSNDEVLAQRFRSKINIPALKLRTYQEALCIPGQLVVKGDCVMPESFRMSLHPIPKNRHLADIDQFYTYPVEIHNQKLAGCFIHLDNEFHDHFGHITVELVSKFWSWEAVVRNHEDVKLLVGMTNGKISPILLKLLALYNIPEEKVVGYEKPTIVETLICPTQQYHIGRYVSPEIEKIWEEISKNAFIDTPLNGRKIFMSRPSTTGRGCQNQSEVENIFRDAGFEIILPEQYSIPEQISITASATILAGFAGSATLNAIYSPLGQKKIIISSNSFTADNDFIISSVKGGGSALFLV